MTVLQVGPDDHGRRLRARREDTIKVRLPENPTTGVRWAVERLEGPVRLSEDTYEETRSGGIGGSGTRVLTLAPEGLGLAEVRLKRWQEWEGASSIDARFACSIIIADEEAS